MDPETHLSDPAASSSEPQQQQLTTEPPVSSPKSNKKYSSSSSSSSSSESESETESSSSESESNSELEKDQNPPTNQKICEICNDNPSKYKCPGCFLLLCSLACSKYHKIDNICTGRKQVGRYIPVKQFTDQNLVDDYRFLADVKRISTVASDVLNESALSQKSKLLRGKAAYRGITLRFLQPHTQKSKENFSFFYPQKKSIVWRLDWIFQCGLESPVTVTKKVSDTLPLVMALSYAIKDLEEEQRKKLASYLTHEINTWSVFLHDLKTPAKDPRWFKLNVSKSLKESLRGKEIIEFPEIHVATPDYLHLYPLALEVINIPAPSPANEEASNKTTEIGLENDDKEGDNEDGDIEDGDLEEVEGHPSKRQKIDHDEEVGQIPNEKPEELKNLATAINSAVLADLFDFE